ncbi:hypothetical protein IKD67_01795 [Candidatus Saccharibacteria bacterium]|nr:hypothetical protein [Candidatus Saccharibacteria bacterium]
MAADSETATEPSAVYSASTDDTSDSGKVTPTRAYKSIYSDIETLIYTGNGSDRWLHITPWVTPNTFTIRMVDYSGTTVWNQTFYTTGTTDWFIGSNVRYVYLQGIPGGVVQVTDTAN